MAAVLKSAACSREVLEDLNKKRHPRRLDGTKTSLEKKPAGLSMDSFVGYFLTDLLEV